MTVWRGRRILSRVRFFLVLLRNVFGMLRAPWHLLRRLRSGRGWVQLRLRSRIVAIPRPRPFWARWVPAVAQAAPTPLPLLVELTEAIEKDPAVDGVLVEIPPLAAGWAVLADVRALLARLRRAGKRVVAYLPEGGGHRELYLASACDRALGGRHATFALTGLASVRRYARPLLARLGVSLEVHRRAEYKTALEGLVEDGMSAPQREQIQALVDATEAELKHALGERGLEAARIDALFARVLLTAEEAVSEGLLDAVVHDDEVAAALAPPSPAPRLVRAGPYHALRRARLFEPFFAPRVAAVVPVVGAIVEVGPPGAASRDQLVPTLRRLAADRQVGAVVLYVDSPGGSALASERIHREVERLAAHKPVVACFGEVAASGGYYVAAAAHAIVARPQTITGSIGVVSARLVASELLASAGVRTEVVKNAPSADYLVHPRPGTEAEKAVMERSIQAFYDRFLEVVGQGRRMTRDAVDAIARGRVWSGTDAHRVGLVDRLGGLPAALAEARERAGAELEPVVAWPSGGEEPPIPAPGAKAAHALLAALDPELADLAALVGAGTEHVLAYATDVPRVA
jgi:protease-4